MVLVQFQSDWDHLPAVFITISEGVVISIWVKLFVRSWLGKEKGIGIGFVNS